MEMRARVEDESGLDLGCAFGARNWAGEGVGSTARDGVGFADQDGLSVSGR